MVLKAITPRFVTLCLTFFLLFAMIYLTLHATPHNPSPSSDTPAKTPKYWPSKLGKLPSFIKAKPTPKLSEPQRPKFAYATFLAGKKRNESDDEAEQEEVEEEDDDDDGYYVSARVMIYQLLHSPTAGTNTSIPFLVLCTTDVSARKRARLTSDGATVIVVDKLEADWVHPGADRWRDVLAKLRLWEQITYEKICFIDADMLVTKNLDGVFWDTATSIRQTLLNPSEIKDDEANLPTEYSFATHADLWGFDHPYPPPQDSTYLNCGFFVFAPSKGMFDYYLSLLAVPGKFDTSFPEQNLLNYAHRREGNMPWQRVWFGWNVNWPTRRDWEGGAGSFHAKYWDGDPAHDALLLAVWREQRAEMEGFYRGREGIGW